MKRLTLDQKRILLVLCDAAERNLSVKLVVTHGNKPIRETGTGTALVRKGLAERLPNGSFRATLEGYWEGDALRLEDRLGKIPARRTR